VVLDPVIPTANLPETPTPTAEKASSRQVSGSIGDLAPEFVGITNWINSEPLTLAKLRGKVVLVDVWTYTCVNCIRTFPFLREWHTRYADDGLVIVGLHAPEFEFEKETQNVVKAATENGIVWPIAQDNNFSTWKAYDNRYWPAKYLIDKDGIVRYTHFGEGAYAETEEKIRQLLKERGADLSDDASSLPSDQAVDANFQGAAGQEVTPELYAGYERNFSAVTYGVEPYVVQTEYYQNRDGVATLEAPEKLVAHKVYFNGDWFVGPESVKHARKTDHFEDYIVLKYSAKSVNAVITSESGEPYKVRLMMDGGYLTEENKGEDVMIGEDGESFILVTEPRLYAIVDNPSYVQGRVLELRPNSDDFGLFAFTFGVYQEGP
jgi:thiol-disulfide isomerase/thioredoxin